METTLNDKEQQLKTLLLQRQNNKSREEFKALILSLPFGVSKEWVLYTLLELKDRKAREKARISLKRMIGEGKIKPLNRYYESIENKNGVVYKRLSCEVLHFISYV